MCGLFGIMSEYFREDEVRTLVRIAENARERGTDAVGWAIINMADGTVKFHRSLDWDRALFETQLRHQLEEPVIIIGNVRAEPTTEWFGGALKANQMHPFTDDDGQWWVVHNGVIANDQELQDAGYTKAESPIDSAVLPSLFQDQGFRTGLMHIKGSYGLLAVDSKKPNAVHVATN